MISSSNAFAKFLDNKRPCRCSSPHCLADPWMHARGPCSEHLPGVRDGQGRKLGIRRRRCRLAILLEAAVCSVRLQATHSAMKPASCATGQKPGPLPRQPEAHLQTLYDVPQGTDQGVWHLRASLCKRLKHSNSVSPAGSEHEAALSRIRCGCKRSMTHACPKSLAVRLSFESSMMYSANVFSEIPK